MNDHLLVEALRTRDPGAPAAVYDAYADRLYAYCWFQLRGRDAAQVALRDTFIVAEAHIECLRDPDRFGPWLYAIARLECGRRLPAHGQPPDVQVASHDQDDVDQRVMAWQAVMGLAPLSRELLELRVRHQLSVPDLAAVFGLPAKDAQAALDAGHAELETALSAEILAHQGPYGCDDRASLLRERKGELEPELRERLLQHAQGCEACGAVVPRTVSAAKVYGLLPQAEPPEALRLRVMSCFMDPELVGYRLFVATRVTDFAADGFPAQHPTATSARRAASQRGPRRTFVLRRAVAPDIAHGGRARALGRLVVALTVAALLIGGAMGVVRLLSGADDRGAGTAATGRSPRLLVPSAMPQPPALQPEVSGGQQAPPGIAPVSATYPLGARESAAPATALPSPPPKRDYQSGGNSPNDPGPPGGTGTLEVSPSFLDLAGGSDATVELHATGGPVTWRARPWGPVRVTPSGGKLAAGQSMTVSVHVFRAAGSQGEGGVTFEPGGLQVQITWRPDPGPGPGPSPTPTPTAPTPTHTTNPPGSGTPTSGPTPPSDPPPSSAPPSSSSPPPTTSDPSSPPPSSSSPPPTSGSDSPSPSGGSGG
ncbi:hypothetical protein [Spirillospora sp. CA-294931]|uniref:hypothetical protein n=1 Tax=Spirillospora sp. CA-294931 TaxID=3240042 RepID=UPI003D8C08CA